MFLKRFFLFMALVIGACGGAWGAEDPCVSGSEMSSTGATITDTNGNKITPQYAVHFDTGKAEDVDNRCTGYWDELFKKIKAKKDAGQIEDVLLLASTDKKGSNDTNLTLSKKRLDFVKRKLEEIGITNPQTMFYLGEGAWADDEADYKKRAVYIFFTSTTNGGASVNICTETVMGALTGLQGKLKGWKSDVSDAEQKLQELIDFCEGGKTNAGQNDVDDFERKLKALLEALPPGLGTLKDFENELKDVKLQLKVARVQAIYAGLSTGGSVWKNKEGKFNAYRLMADSTGAVVLGTAGALLSSHLIKKAQVKEGFEDLQCTIGGQLVANWGDEFLPRVTFVQ